MRTREEVETTIRSILRQIKELASDYQNCEPFRDRMVALADSQMHTFHEYGEVHDYKCICDETNNSPDMIDAQGFKFLLAVVYKEDKADIKLYSVGYTEDEMRRMGTS